MVCFVGDVSICLRLIMLDSTDLQNKGICYWNICYWKNNNVWSNLCAFPTWTQLVALQSIELLSRINVGIFRNGMAFHVLLKCKSANPVIHTQTGNACTHTRCKFMRWCDVPLQAIFIIFNSSLWPLSPTFTLIPVWMNNYTHDKEWDEIIYQFPNFNGGTVEVWEWINNFIPHFTGHVIHAGIKVKP